LKVSVPDLHADWDGFGEPGRPVLVLLHGFTGSGKSWEGVRDGLRGLGATLAVDLIGHGASPVPEEVEPYTIPACLEQLEALLERLGIASAWWLGYSMGGRVALQMAAHKPARVEGLILESATPGIPDAPSRAERVRTDEQLAASILADGLAPFVELWLNNPLFAGLRELPQGLLADQRERRMECNPLGLANSLRGMGTGSMEPLWDNLPGLDVPALLLAGRRDTKFADLGREMAALLPRATLRLMPGAYHVPHVENPAEFLAAVTEFFETLYPWETP
jgi:2-succinyl-6-hydroxy-2,4-cyclohexadiene-1-carboxylate synthase